MLGPVDYLNTRFLDEHSFASVAPALADLVDRQLIHIIDLVFVHKDTTGAVTVSELEELGADTAAAFAPVGGEYGGLLSDQDITDAAATLEPGSGEVLLVWENLWAKDLMAALADAGGAVAQLLHVDDATADSIYASLPPDDPDDPDDTATGPDRERTNSEA